jgi:hypothetical protein
MDPGWVSGPRVRPADALRLGTKKVPGTVSDGGRVKAGRRGPLKGARHCFFR